MKDITVKKGDLLLKLKANRVSHKENYDKALMVDKEALTLYLEKMYKRAKAGKKVSHAIQLSIPTNNLRDYDLIIGMLEMTIDDDIVLTPQEYSQYVNDDWNWRSSFTNNTLSYSNFTGSVGLGLAGAQGALGVAGSGGYEKLFQVDDINVQDFED